MNKQIIIGNLTRDPEKRTTRDGVGYTTFTVAVNRKSKRTDGTQEVDYFRVTAWRGLGETCAQYLAKGRKVLVIGPSSISVYTGQDGQARGNLEITADEVEFLTPRGSADPAGEEQHG